MFVLRTVAHHIATTSVCRSISLEGPHISKQYFFIFQLEINKIISILRPLYCGPEDGLNIVVLLYVVA